MGRQPTDQGRQLHRRLVGPQHGAAGLSTLAGAATPARPAADGLCTLGPRDWAAICSWRWRQALTGAMLSMIAHAEKTRGWGFAKTAPGSSFSALADGPGLRRRALPAQLGQQPGALGPLGWAGAALAGSASCSRRSATPSRRLQRRPVNAGQVMGPEACGAIPATPTTSATPASMGPVPDRRGARGPGACPGRC
ncbi:hypothetical protein ACRAWD_01625 [Caulobacter segnis]